MYNVPGSHRLRAAIATLSVFLRNKTFLAKDKLGGSFKAMQGSAYEDSSGLPKVACPCNSYDEVLACLRLAQARGLPYKMLIQDYSENLQGAVMSSLRNVEAEIEFASCLLIVWIEE